MDFSFPVSSHFNDHSRSHSEYYSALHNSPLVLVGRRTLFRMLNLICNKIRSSRFNLTPINNGWRHLFMKREIIDPLFTYVNTERMTNVDRYKDDIIFSPATQTLFTTDILRVIQNIEDNFGCLSSCVVSEYISNRLLAYKQ